MAVKQSTQLMRGPLVVANAAHGIMRKIRVLCARWLYKAACLIGPSTPPANPEPQLLQDLTEHVAHELAAMEAAARFHQQSQLWIALEDFLLHARILSEFFWPGQSARLHAESAVLAEHYLERWRANSGGPPPVIRSTKEAIDQQLAHIARERVTKPQDLAGHVPAIRAAVWDAWKRFIAQLGSSPYADQFKAHLRNRCAILGLTPPAGAT